MSRLTNRDYVIGVDEAGRGPLAGPVTVSAVLIPSNLEIKKIQSKRNLINLKDSKKHTPDQRDVWFRYIKNNPHIKYSLSSVFPRVIERVNISNAVNHAAKRAVEKLLESSKVKLSECSILLDGGMKIDKLPYKSIIKGDEKIDAIKLASIVAKVKRDKSMERYHKLFNQYNFKKHKGYGTQEHRDNIKKYGPCRIHRLTFI